MVSTLRVQVSKFLCPWTCFTNTPSMVRISEVRASHSFLYTQASSGWGQLSQQPLLSRWPVSTFTADSVICFYLTTLPSHLTALEPALDLQEILFPTTGGQHFLPPLLEVGEDCNCCRWVNEYELETAAQLRKEEATKERDVSICTMKYRLHLCKMEKIKRALYMKHLPIAFIISLCSQGGGPVRSCSFLKPDQSWPFILSSSPPHTRKL